MSTSNSPDPNVYYVNTSTAGSSVVNNLNQYITTATSPTFAAGGNTWSLGTNWNPTCPEHILEEELVEYIDGVVISYCVNCKTRIEIPRLPGGVHVLQVEELVRRLAASAHGDDEVSVDLGEFVACREAIRAQREALDNAMALLNAAEQLLRERGIDP